MRTSIGLSFTVSFALLATSANALNFSPRNMTEAAMTQAIDVATKATTMKKSVKMRSVTYLSSRLTKKGYAVKKARRKGQIYFFRTTKNGYSAIISIDARNGKIVGLKVLKAPAGKKLRPAKSIGNRFVDETYEFGYAVDETYYQSCSEFSSAEYFSTEEYASYSIQTSEFISYEEISSTVTETSITTESDDLDQGEPGDSDGNQVALTAADDLPEATSEDFDSQTAEETSEETESTEETTKLDDPPAEESEPEKVEEPTQPEEQSEEPQAEEPVEEPQAEEPVQEEPVEEPQVEEPVEEPQAEEPQYEEPQEECPPEGNGTDACPSS